MKKITIVFVAVTIIIAACGKGGGDDKAKLEELKKQLISIKSEIATLEAGMAKTDTAANEKLKMVGLTVITPQLFNNYIEVQARVEADENITVSPEMPGSVVKINVKEGDEVMKGQVLAEMDSKVTQQGMAELKTGLDLATTVYEKQKNLWDQKIGSEIQFLQAKNTKEGLEKKMATLQQQLEMAKIKSPINGSVDEVYLKLGQTAAPGYPAVRVVNFANLKVKAEVPEAYASKVKKGNTAVVFFPDMKDSITAQVTFSAKVISALNRTFNVEVALDNSKEYHPNMITILKIVDYSNKAAMVVPVKTIQKAEEGDFVFVADGNKAKKVKVQVGKVYNGNAEILSGLKEGDKLISAGFEELNEGEEVKF